MHDTAYASGSYRTVARPRLYAMNFPQCSRVPEQRFADENETLQWTERGNVTNPESSCILFPVSQPVAMNAGRKGRGLPWPVEQSRRVTIACKDSPSSSSLMQLIPGCRRIILQNPSPDVSISSTSQSEAGLKARHLFRHKALGAFSLRTCTGFRLHTVWQAMDEPKQ
ncbi:hypothetical protein ZHAS_00004538 [Anopheles sinensis]|uniref:Uncharacterized protein n=1 Tax=Anopheles sinensis TaxID=74873 RepID=A0A084VHG3_ANOSI|nr:hypothetical protein ZHAS_00004538 [Anopheles sinensis]